jgi:hypothetical protein
MVSVERERSSLWRKWSRDSDTHVDVGGGRVESVYGVGAEIENVKET